MPLVSRVIVKILTLVQLSDIKITFIISFVGVIMRSPKAFFSKEERKVLECLRKHRDQRSWGFGRAVEELGIPLAKVTRITKALNLKKLDFLHVVGEALELGLIDETELEDYLVYKLRQFSA